MSIKHGGSLCDGKDGKSAAVSVHGGSVSAWQGREIERRYLTGTWRVCLWARTGNQGRALISLNMGGVSLPLARTGNWRASLR